MEKCIICGHDLHEIVYEGRIRIGKFNNLSDVPVTVKRCRSCLAVSLPTMIDDPSAYYESEAYRREVDEGIDVQDYYRQHDGEMLRYFNVTGTAVFRNKVVADIGCGAGSFLDYIRGVCKYAIAVEPAAHYRKSLAERGYRVYPYTYHALSEHKNSADVVLSFSVLEHIQNPLVFLREIHALMKEGGKLIISTPNADDILLKIIPDTYASFFYRKAHLWYFNADSLKNLLDAAGFTKNRIIPFHRFGFGNFVGWIRDRKPQGDVIWETLGESLDLFWKAELEKTFQGDYLYAMATKGNENE